MSIRRGANGEARAAAAKSRMQAGEEKGGEGIEFAEKAPSI